MSLRFRPYPGLTIAAVILIAILTGLGVWQLQRLQWKLALIARVTAHMTEAPVSLDQALKMSPDEVQYRRVALAGRFDNAREAYVFTTGEHGEPVYHVLTPFHLDDGRALLVDRGEVPKELLAPSARAQGQIEGETRVVGVWRVPDAPGFFTPAPVTRERLWFSRDVQSIAALDGVKVAAPAVIEADATPNPGGWPRGGQTVVDFPNNHLSYALTWFGLAAGLFGVYLAYHMSKDRLRWSN